MAGRKDTIFAILRISRNWNELKFIKYLSHDMSFVRLIYLSFLFFCSNSNRRCCCRVLKCFYHNDCATRYYNTSCMRDLALTIARDARVIADVFVPYCGYTKFGAIIKNTNSWRWIDGIRIFVPAKKYIQNSLMNSNKSLQFAKKKCFFSIWAQSVSWKRKTYHKISGVGVPSAWQLRIIESPAMNI